jgi:hypothetical protein
VSSSGRAFLAIAIAGLALFSAPAGSSACACGPSARFVVAKGTSPNGAPWRIKADEEKGTRFSPRNALLEFSTGSPDEYNGAGYFSSFGLPIPRGFVFHANSGSGVYPELEGDVSGYARPRAVRLVAKMSAGPPIEIETQRAPERLRERFPWLRGLVFFDQFYAAEIEPVAITAYGRDGRVLSRQPA